MTSLAGQGAPVDAAALLRRRWDVVYFPLGAAAYGGAERSLLEIATAHARAGLAVLVCHEPALAATGFVTDARAAGLPLLPLRWAPERSAWAVAREALALFSRLDAGVLQFNISWRPGMWTVPLAARLASRARLIGTMRAMPEPLAALKPRRYFGLFDGPPLRHLQELGLGRVWGHALHRTVSVNRDDYPRRLVAEYGFPQRRLSVIYNGVRLPAARAEAAERAAARARWAMGDGVFALGYVGRLSTEKGIGYAVDALALADPRVELWIAGEGPEAEPLRQRAAERGVAARVHFAGYLADPSSLYAAADAVVVPSLWNEAFGRVVVEAMGHGTPVIATRVGGMQELFTDGTEGWFVPRADAAAVAAAAGRWVHDPRLRERMAAASRALAEARFSTVRVAGEYGALYRELGVASRA